MFLMFAAYIELFCLLIAFLAFGGSADRQYLCVDANKLASVSVNDTNIAQLSKFNCPYDRISESICKEHLSSTVIFDNKSHQDTVEWKDVVMFILVGSKGLKTNVIKWWMQFLSLPKGQRIDLILVADACTEPCNDTAIAFQELIHSNPHSQMNVTVVRARQRIDEGYSRLACKLVTGAAQIYKLFPKRKYFFKLDDDTVVFPKRLLAFINTLHSVTNGGTAGAFSGDSGTPVLPLYFGTVSHLHKGGVPLCGEMGWVVPNSTVKVVLSATGNSSSIGSGGRKDNTTNGSTSSTIAAELWSQGRVSYQKRDGSVEGLPVCYAQGGAGYGLNNVAMASLADTPLCTLEMDLESESEDTFVGFKLFRDLRAKVIHCGAFRPSGVAAELHLDSAITFHHTSEHWLNSRDVAAMKRNFPDIF